jgi:hypothetical protein
MRKYIVSIAIIFISISSVIPFIYAVELDTLLNKDYLTSSEVIQNADILDGYKITLRGEVVSESIERDGFCWINVYDTQNFISIGVLTNVAMIEDIQYWGDHKTTGDTIDVVGTVYRADPKADGELDMHAESISIVQSYPSGPRDIVIPLWKIIVAIILFIGMIIILVERFLSFIKLRNHQHEHVLEQYMDES